MPKTSFARLREILLGLDFQLSPVGGGAHVMFEHPPTKTRLVMPGYKDDEAVDQATLMMVRRFLDVRGILSCEEFEELLRHRSLAG